MPLPFQSSPTPKGGRYRVLIIIRHDQPGFQSSPTPKGGRYMARMMVTASSLCFNPRPPRKVGATFRGDIYARQAHQVSILAHPERWALPGAFLELIKEVMFQSSPTPKGGRY